MSVGQTLQRFGFRQTVKGALIIGLLAGFMVALQGVAYKATYSDKAAQEQFAASLKSAPSLGILYGDVNDLDHGVNGYVAYRTVSFMSLVVAIWGIMAVTKLLRGNEEDGRWEVLRAGATTARSSTIHTSLGFLYAFVLSFVISFIATLLMGAVPDIETPLHVSLLINVAIFAPALLFIGLGVLVSQLATTRRRTLLYGLAPLLFAYFVRIIGNTAPDDRGWLLNWTPFGWNQLMSPVISPQPWWAVPFIAVGALFAAWGILLAKRDLGSGVIPESKTTHSRFYLLGGPGRLALRLNFWIFAAWAAGTFAVTAIITNVITIAADATAESPALSKSVYALAQNSTNLKVAFLGAGLVFIVMVLMIFVTAIIGGIRNDEAKQYLDNILVQPIRRTHWLLTRLAIGALILLGISLACGGIILAIGSSQDLGLDTRKVLQLTIAMAGTSLFLLGLGTFFYGLLPRFSSIILYIVIVWSFIIDLVGSAVTLDDWLLKSSLFHYLSFNLADWPDWTTFAWFVGIGMCLAIGGALFFARRDIISE